MDNSILTFNCSQKNVENRFRTLKGNWNIITELRQKSGFGWNDDLKMITCDKNVYDKAVAVRNLFLSL
jgi:hypothetical protein